MNAFFVAMELSMYQVWNPQRRWITVALLLLPALIIFGAYIFGVNPGAQFYQGFVTRALGTFIVPFVALYWGSSALTDEIEGKTLVYLWTRPCNRGLLMLARVMGTWIWLIALSVIGVVSAFLFTFAANDQSGGIAANFPMVIWDSRALILTGMAYSSLGFLLSVFTKRPMIYGLLIAYLWEIVPNIAPGFIRRISITQQMLSLATHTKKEESGIARRLIEQIEITETQALLTLLGITIVFSTIAAAFVGQREFLSDDPARDQ